MPVCTPYSGSKMIGGISTARATGSGSWSQVPCVVGDVLLAQRSGAITRHSQIRSQLYLLLAHGCNVQDEPTLVYRRRMILILVSSSSNNQTDPWYRKDPRERHRLQIDAALVQGYFPLSPPWRVRQNVSWALVPAHLGLSLN